MGDNEESPPDEGLEDQVPQILGIEKFGVRALPCQVEEQGMEVFLFHIPKILAFLIGFLCADISSFAVCLRNNFQRVPSLKHSFYQFHYGIHQGYILCCYGRGWPCPDTNLRQWCGVRALQAKCVFCIVRPWSLEQSLAGIRYSTKFPCLAF